MQNLFSTTTKTFFFDDENSVVPLWQLLDETIFQSQKKLVKQHALEIKSEVKLKYKSELKKIELGGIENAFLYIFNGANQYLLANFYNLRFQSYPKNFQITLFRNNEQSDLYFSNEIIFNEWNTFLSKYLIQHDFHEAFEVKRMIGKGKYAKVYYAVKKGVEGVQEFAVKAFCKQAVLKSQEGKWGIVNELQILRALRHQNILPLIGAYESEHSLYLVFPYFQLGSLASYLKQKKFIAQSQLKIILRDILSALSYCAEQNIFHRDVKLENILVKDENSVVLSDFGLAMEKNIGSDTAFKRCGTPGYVAPEVLKWKEKEPFYDSKCDVFSLGCLFYYLVSGQRVFKGNNAQEVLQRTSECNIDFTLCNNLNYSGIELLKAMLQENPIVRISAKDALWHSYLFKENDCNINLIDDGINWENLTQSQVTSNCVLKMQLNGNQSPVSIYMQRPIQNEQFERQSIGSNSIGPILKKQKSFTKSSAQKWCAQKGFYSPQKSNEKQDQQNNSQLMTFTNYYENEVSANSQISKLTKEIVEGEFCNETSQLIRLKLQQCS